MLNICSIRSKPATPLVLWEGTFIFLDGRIHFAVGCIPSVPENCEVPLNKNIFFRTSALFQSACSFFFFFLLTDVPLTIDQIVWVCVWGGREPHRECVGERRRERGKELCLILLSALVGQIGARQAKQETQNNISHRRTTAWAFGESREGGGDAHMD